MTQIDEIGADQNMVVARPKAVIPPRVLARTVGAGYHKGGTSPIDVDAVTADFFLKPGLESAEVSGICMIRGLPWIMPQLLRR